MYLSSYFKAFILVSNKFPVKQQFKNSQDVIHLHLEHSADTLMQSNIQKCFKVFTNKQINASLIGCRLRIQ